MASCPQPLSVQNRVGTERKNNKLKTASIGRKDGEHLNKWIPNCQKFRSSPSIPCSSCEISSRSPQTEISLTVGNAKGARLIHMGSRTDRREPVVCSPERLR